jgi:hypothetical protein
MTVNIKGYEVLIDDEDYELVKAHVWNVSKHKNLVYFWYNKRISKKDNRYLLHRLIINAPEGSITDHINRNTLDNRKANLRITDKIGNARNRVMSSNNTSGYRGVIFDKRVNQWGARIEIYGKLYCLGYYPTKEIAAYVREEAAKIIHGEYYSDMKLSLDLTIPLWHKPCKAQKNSSGWHTRIKHNKKCYSLTGYKTEAELQKAYKKIRAEIGIKNSLESANETIRKAMGGMASSKIISNLADTLMPQKREPMQLVCKNCGKTFYSMAYHAKYCCQRCYEVFYYKEYMSKHKHTCLHCGKEFTGLKNQKYCSLSCARKAVTTRKAG